MRKIKFDDEIIKNLSVNTKGRLRYSFKGVDGLIPGVTLRYTPKKNKKVFQFKYWFEDKTKVLDLGIFSETFTTEHLLTLYKRIIRKSKDPLTGKFIRDPKSALCIQDVDISNKITLREAIESFVESNFPRKKLEGNLSKHTQNAFARCLIGYNSRFEKLKFTENEKGWGQITLSPEFKTWGDFWKTYGPGVGLENRPKNSIRSLYDSSLVDEPMREITYYELQQYLNNFDIGYGSKKNILTCYNALYNFGLKKGLLGKPQPPNPTTGVQLEMKEDSQSIASIHNETIYTLDELRLMDRELIKMAKSRPYQTEAIMMCIACRLRIEEIRKLQWSQIKKGEEGYYFEVPRYQTKGRSRANQKNEIIHITDALQRVLDRVQRQNKRKGHAKYRLIPYIFPSTRSSYEKLRSPGEHPGYHLSDDCRISNVSIRNAFRDLRKTLGIKHGSVKSLRKTHITHSNRILGGEHIARHYTGHKTPWVIVRNYDKAKQVEIRKMSDKVSKIMFGK